MLGYKINIIDYIDSILGYTTLTQNETSVKLTEIIADKIEQNNLDIFTFESFEVNTLENE